MTKSALLDKAPKGTYTGLDRLVGARQPARDLSLFMSKPALARMQGESRSRFRGRGMEFEEARIYAPGDDVRTIDWRVTARTGITHTKVFREERERPVHILVDQRSNMFFGSRQWFKSAFAAEFAALLAWAALEGSDRIGGQIVGDRQETDIRARRSRHSVLKFLRELATYNHLLPDDSHEATSLAAMLEECHRLVRPGTAVFIISDFIDFDSSCERPLSLIGRHADISLIQVLDPLECLVPAVGRTRLTDGHSSSDVVLDRATAKHLQAVLLKQREQLAVAARASRASLHQVRTDDEPFNFLRRLYPR